MFTGKMQTQMWTHKSVIMKLSHKQNKINPQHAPDNSAGECDGV